MALWELDSAATHLLGWVDSRVRRLPTPGNAGRSAWADGQIQSWTRRPRVLVWGDAEMRCGWVYSRASRSLSTFLSRCAAWLLTLTFNKEAALCCSKVVLWSSAAELWAGHQKTCVLRVSSWPPAVACHTGATYAFRALTCSSVRWVPSLSCLFHKALCGSHDTGRAKVLVETIKHSPEVWPY